MIVKHDYNYNNDNKLLLKAVKQWRNQYDKCIGYTLQDEYGNIRDVTTEEIKKAINTGKIRVINLKLTADQRLIQYEADLSKSNISAKVNVAIENYPYRDNEYMVCLWDINNKKSYFITSNEYKLIKDELNVNRDNDICYKNVKTTLGQVLDKHNIKSKREEYLAEYKGKLDDHIQKHLELLIIDNGEPVIAIYEALVKTTRFLDINKVSSYETYEHLLCKDKNELRQIFSCAGFNNVKIINGKLWISSFNKPLILNKKDLADTEIIYTSYYNSSLFVDNGKSTQVALRKLRDDEDIEQELKKLQDMSKSLQGLRIDFNDETVLNNYKVIDDTKCRGELVSHASRIIISGVKHGIKVINARNVHDKEYLYINNTKITDKVDGVKDFINSFKDINSISDLINISLEEALIAGLQLRRVPDRPIFYIKIPETEFDIKFETYTPDDAPILLSNKQSLHSWSYRVSIQLMKGDKIVKRISNFHTHLSQLDNDFLTLKINGVAVSNTAITIVVDYSTSIKINIA